MRPAQRGQAGEGERPHVPDLRGARLLLSCRRHLANDYKGVAKAAFRKKTSAEFSPRKEKPPSVWPGATRGKIVTSPLWAGFNEKFGLVSQFKEQMKNWN